MEKDVNEKLCYSALSTRAVFSEVLADVVADELVLSLSVSLFSVETVAVFSLLPVVPVLSAV